MSNKAKFFISLGFGILAIATAPLVDAVAPGLPLILAFIPGLFTGWYGVVWYFETHDI